MLDHTKSVKKMIKNSDPWYENEIHTVDSPFNEDSKNDIFARDALISEEGRPNIQGKWPKTGKLCKLWGGQF